MSIALNGRFLVSFNAGTDLQLNNLEVKKVNTTAIYSATIIPVIASASAVTVNIGVSPTNPTFYFQDIDDSNTLTVSVTIGGVARTLKVQPVLVLSDTITAITVSNSSTTARNMRFIIFGSSS